MQGAKPKHRPACFNRNRSCSFAFCSRAISLSADSLGDQERYRVHMMLQKEAAVTRRVLSKDEVVIFGGRGSQTHSVFSIDFERDLFVLVPFLPMKILRHREPWLNAFSAAMLPDRYPTQWT